MSLHRFARPLLLALCVARASATDAPAGWLVTGPWDVKIQGELRPAGPVLTAEVTGLHLTLDLDQSPPRSSPPRDATSVIFPAPKFPPFVQEVRLNGGEFILKQGGISRVLAWRGTFVQTAAGVWAGDFSAEGGGAMVKLTLGYDASSQTWAASNLEAKLGLAEWAPLVIARLRPADEAWTCTGSVEARGALRWSRGGLAGQLTLTLANGSARNADGKIFLDGASARLNLTGFAPLTSSPGGRFTVQSLTAGKITLTDLDVGLDLLPPARLQVRATARGLGGKVVIEPFEINPAVPALRMDTTLTEVEAHQVLALFPHTPDSDGVISGRVPVIYENGVLRLGTGRLQLKPGTKARVHFHHPGLFTQAWSHWMPGRSLVSGIETGREAFLVNELTIDIHPPDAPPGRAAEVHLVGIPADHPRQGPFTFDFNINAPLEGFLNLGLQPNVHLELK